MRYHWGLAVGHLYTRGRHKSRNTSQSRESPDEGIDVAEAGGDIESEPLVQTEGALVDNNSDDGEDAEFGLESRDAESLPYASDSDSEKEDESNVEDDERLLAMDEMYN